jgi:magnesium transporter
MLVMYDQQANGLSRREGMGQLTEATTWIDMVNPTPEEEAYLESALGVEVPTREEMREIEVSSRLYQENGAHFMTAMLVIQYNQHRPVTTFVTFVLLENRLVTIRYEEPFSFQMFSQRAMRGQMECATAGQILIGLLEAIIDRLADLIEKVQGDVDVMSTTVFAKDDRPSERSQKYDDALRSIGLQGDVTTRARESLLSLNRLLTYFAHVCTVRKDEKVLRARIKTAARDVTSLADHLNYLNGQITLLLDATLGLISIEQNAIIKIFSVAAVVFMPPTLVASIYGMNFQYMPELSWPFGYAYALVMIAIAALIPLLYFRYKGWLGPLFRWGSRAKPKPAKVDGEGK